MNKLRKIAATIVLMALCVFNFTGSSMQAQAAAKEASETVDWYKTVYQLDPDVKFYVFPQYLRKCRVISNALAFANKKVVL